MVPLIILVATLGMMGIEAVRPGRAWPRVSGWLSRAWLVSGLQALVVIGFGHSFDAWLERHRFFRFGAQSDVWGVALGYVAVTFVFYFWHRARHEQRWLWRFVHQFHHSPQRIEVIT